MSAKKNETFDHVITRTFEAPREMVWNAWTDPKQMAAWWGPHAYKSTVKKMDVRPGGDWYVIMRGPEETDLPCVGQYVEIKKPERLVFTIDHSDLPDDWHDIVNPNRDKSAPKPTYKSLTTVEFEDRGRFTKMTLTLAYESAAIRDLLRGVGMDEGWSESLEKLASITEFKAEPFVIERTFDAPVATVWHAITTKEAIEQWSFDIPHFKPEVGYEFEFYGEKDGIKFHHKSVVKEVVPLKKLAYSWRYEGYEGNSLVTIELFEEGKKTRLKLTHAGLETFSKTPDFASGNFKQGWTMIIGELLKKFVEQSDREIITSRFIDASKEKIFRAWTDPVHLAKWWGPKGFTNTFHEFNLCPGGLWKFTMHSPDGANYENVCRYEEITPNDRVTFEHLKPGHHFHVTATFDGAGGKTRVTFRMLFDTAEECQKIKGFIAEKNEENFDRLEAELANIK